MKCPKCGAESSVTETRHVEPGMNRRRRACDNLQCNYRFSTLELPIEANRRHADAVVLILPKAVARELQAGLTAISTRLGARLPQDLGSEGGDAEQTETEHADADRLAVRPEPRVEEPAAKPRE